MDYEERLGSGIYQPGGFARERLPEDLDKTGAGLEPDINPDVADIASRVPFMGGRTGAALDVRQRIADLGETLERVPLLSAFATVAVVVLGLVASILVTAAFWKRGGDYVGENLIKFGNRMRSAAR